MQLFCKGLAVCIPKILYMMYMWVFEIGYIIKHIRLKWLLFGFFLQWEHDNDSTNESTDIVFGEQNLMLTKRNAQQRCGLF
jgi:hypothetical protein